MKNLKLITIFVLLLSMTEGASAQSAKEYEQRKAKLEREIAIIDKQLAENNSKSSSLMADLSLSGRMWPTERLLSLKVTVRSRS